MKDRRAITRAFRRLGSTRAAAFLEFCMIAPILVMFCSGIFEFVQLWDAKIMANHAAWTVGRIASVRAGASTSPDAVPVTRGMKFATAALMSTATMGIGGDAGKPSRSWLSGPLQGDIHRLTEGLHLSGADGQMSAVVDEFPEDYLVVIFGPKVGAFLSKLFSSSVANVVNGSIEDVKTGLWKPILNTWHPAAKMSEILRSCQTYGVEDGDRQLRQMGVAQQLVNRTVDGQPVLSVTEGQASPFVLGKDHSLSGDTSPDFPRCLDETAQFDSWRVMQDSSWPPKGAAQRMILVAVSWPFERAWLYPIFSRTKWSGKDPVAVGESIAYPQPKISNANLRSVGAEAYKRDKEPPIPKEFGNLREQYVNFLKTAAFAITYRLGHEFIGAHDSDVNTSGSYKGLGLMPVTPDQYKSIKKRFGSHQSPWVWEVDDKACPLVYSRPRDGICYWMDRAKLPPRAKDDPYGLKLKADDVEAAWKARDSHYADYLWGWRAVAIFPEYGDKKDKEVRSGKTEKWLYKKGLWTKRFKCINNYTKVHENEWFYWGKDTGPELTLGGVKAPCEREQHLHRRHRKSKSLDDVLNRRYEDTYLDSSYKRSVHLEKYWCIYNDFSKCGEDSKNNFFPFWDPDKKDKISTLFDSADRWNKFKAKAEGDHRFYPTLKNAVDGFLTGDRHREFCQLENDLKVWARKAVNKYDTMIKLLEEEQAEFERTIFGGAMPTPGKDDGSIWDFGIDERDVQKDPKKALKDMDERIKKKRTESMNILYGIIDRICWARDKKVPDLLDRHLPKWPTDSRGARQQFVVSWMNNVVAVYKESPDLNWEDHMAQVREKYPTATLPDWMYKDLKKSSQQMRDAMRNLHGAIEDLYQQELNYGLALGLRAAGAAKRRGEKKIEPVNPGDWPPKPPPAPDRRAGSDPDYLGDGWRLEGSGERRGWKSVTDEGWKP